MRGLIRPDQTLSVARQAGLGDAELKMTGMAVLTFSKAVVHRLEELCQLRDAEWLSPAHHPYAAPHVVKRGRFQGMDICVLVPPMGASPLACILEDLVACGVDIVFLVCASWSLGPPVQLGDLIVPNFSAGPDGTSIHYGNDQGKVDAQSRVVDALVEGCKALSARYHTGGNGTCEAFYRIKPQMAERFRKNNCLCMDNGEANTLIAVAQTLGVWGGVLFQPYIELAAGWNPNFLRTEEYQNTCRIQAEVVLHAGTQLMESPETFPLPGGEGS
jgi:uridine phosphorylase